MIAFVDESLRQVPDGLYLMAAVVLVDQDVERAREQTKEVLLPRQPLFHWRNESEQQRLLMMRQIAGLGPTVFGYRCPMPPKSDRARALCLNGLLWDLREHEVDRLVIESRQERNDAKDRQTIVRSLKAERAPADLTYVFARSSDEPLLWLADAMAGAILAHLGEGRTEYLDVLPSGQVKTLEIQP